MNNVLVRFVSRLVWPLLPSAVVFLQSEIGHSKTDTPARPGRCLVALSKRIEKPDLTLISETNAYLSATAWSIDRRFESAQAWEEYLFNRIKLASNATLDRIAAHHPEILPSMQQILAAERTDHVRNLHWAFLLRRTPLISAYFQSVQNHHRDDPYYPHLVSMVMTMLSGYSREQLLPMLAGFIDGYSHLSKEQFSSKALVSKKRIADQAIATMMRNEFSDLSDSGLEDYRRYLSHVSALRLLPSSKLQEPARILRFYSGVNDWLVTQHKLHPGREMKISIFGSLPNGRAHDESDLDFAVFIRNQDSSEWQRLDDTSLAGKLRPILERTFDAQISSSDASIQFDDEPEFLRFALRRNPVVIEITTPGVELVYQTPDRRFERLKL